MDHYPELNRTKGEELTDWMEDAACLDTDPDAWFPTSDRPGFGEEAVAICHSCPVRLECLNAALQEERGLKKTRIHGIRGGLGPTSRIQIRKQVYGE